MATDGGFYATADIRTVKHPTTTRASAGRSSMCWVPHRWPNGLQSGLTANPTEDSLSSSGEKKPRSANPDVNPDDRRGGSSLWGARSAVG